MPDALGLTACPARSIATITAFRDVRAIREAVETAFSLVLPDTPRFVQSSEMTLSCLSPGRFLATAERSANLPARLRTLLNGQAAITDQSDLWTYFNLSGPDIREHLARLVPIDLAPKIFPIGAVAQTRAGHLDVRLWHVTESIYELAILRSYAQDFDFQRSAGP